MGRSDLLARLHANLWFQLSLAGQELFHSNMLSWLAKYRSEESSPVWDLLAPGFGLPHDAAREAKDIDLTIKCAAGKLILENKVFGSLHSREMNSFASTTRS